MADIGDVTEPDPSVLGKLVYSQSIGAPFRC
jgi:hypothetical protein